MKKLLWVLMMIAIFVSPAAADRSLAGSYVQLVSPDPALFIPGDSYTVDFYVFNGSPDVEWIVEVWFLFPDCFHVTGGSYTPDAGVSGSWNFTFDTFGSPDNGAQFYDSSGGNGEIWGDEGGHFYVDLIVDEDCICGPDSIEWYLEGDTWGADPHWLGGNLNITLCDDTSTQETEWSVIKSLY